MAPKWQKSSVSPRVSYDGKFGMEHSSVQRRGPKIELMYIRHNAHSAREVRLMARNELEEQSAPIRLNEALANLSPRRALLAARDKKSEHIILGAGSNWDEGYQHDGSRMEGNGVKLCGALSPINLSGSQMLGTRLWSANRVKRKKNQSWSEPTPPWQLDQTPTEEGSGPIRGLKRNSFIDSDPMRGMKRNSFIDSDPIRGLKRNSFIGPISTDPPFPSPFRIPPSVKPNGSQTARHLESSVEAGSPSSPRRNSMYNPGDITHRSTIRHVLWPRSKNEESTWVVMTRKLKKRIRNRFKTVAYAEAAESSFLGFAQDFQHATSLEVSAQQLPKIPRQWLNPDLTLISFKACKLESLPTHFGLRTPQLQQLFLDHNRLTSLPDSCELLTELRDLGLTANLFTTFPVVVARLTALKTLSLANNHIEEFPPCLGYCQQMQAMYLSKNPVSSLPLTIGLMKHLRILTVDVTDDMVSPPAGICRLGIDILFKYLSLHMHNAIVLFRNQLRKTFLKAKAAFQQFDMNHDGILDQSEVREALATMKVNLDYFDDLWVCLDKDNSGAVDHNEFFENMMKNQHETLRDPRAELGSGVDEAILEEAYRNVHSMIKPMRMDSLKKLDLDAEVKAFRNSRLWVGVEVK